MKTIYDLIIDSLRERAKQTLSMGEKGCTEFELQYFMSLTMDDVEAVIHKIAEEYNNGWILTSKKLPEEPKNDEDLTRYIVMIEGAEKPATLFYAGLGNWYEDGTFYKVTMWQPFPMMPKQKQYAWDHTKRLQEISKRMSAQAEEKEPEKG